MISIKVGNYFFELNSDTRINLKRKNPIFADGKVIPGSYSIPFEIPIGEASPANSEALNHIDIIENADCFDRINAELYIDKVLYQVGDLKITGVDDLSITTNFVFGFETLSQSIKELTLRDIMSEEIVLFADNAYQKEVILDYNTENVEIPLTINGSTYTVYVTNASDSKQPWVDAINAESAENNCVASLDVNGNLKLVPNNNPNDIETPFNIVGEARFWKAYNNYSSDFHPLIAAAIEPYLEEQSLPDDKVRFPMFYNQGVYQINEHFTNFVNANVDGVLKANSAGEYDPIFDLGFSFQPFNYNSLCPWIKLKYVMQQIETYFGFEFEGDFVSSPFFEKALIENTKYLDVSIPFLGERNTIFYRNKFNIADHLPDMKVNEFLKALQSRYNLAIYFDEQRKKVIIKFRNPIVGANEYTDLTKISGKTFIKEVLCKKGYQLRSPANEDDSFSSVDKFVVNPDFEETLETTALHASQYINKYDELYTYEYELAAFEKEQNAKELRFLFEKFDKSTTGFGSGAFMTALLEEETKGYFFASIYDEYWDQYIRFLTKRKTVETTMDIPLRILLQLDFEKKIRIGQIEYFLKELDVTFNMHGIEPAKLQLYSL